VKISSKDNPVLSRCLGTVKEIRWVITEYHMGPYLTVDESNNTVLCTEYSVLFHLLADLSDILAFFMAYLGIVCSLKFSILC
jgi:hypothetical protein